MGSPACLILQMLNKLLECTHIFTPVMASLILHSLSGHGVLQLGSAIDESSTLATFIRSAFQGIDDATVAKQYSKPVQ